MNNEQDQTKTCTKCDESKPLTAFSKLIKSNGNPGYNSHCKECRNKASKQKDNKRITVGNKHCKGCERILSIDNFTSCKANKDGLQTYCKECKHDMQMDWGSEIDGYITKIINDLNHNIKKNNTEWNITITKQDIKDLYLQQKEKCALSGIKLTHLSCQTTKDNYKINKHNMVIDRIDPNEDYTKDNIRLICAIVSKMKIYQTETEFMTMCKNIVNNQK